jgi:hypothetical protein
MMGAHIFVQCSFVGGPTNECLTRHFALCFTALPNLISRTGETLETPEKKNWGKPEYWNDGMMALTRSKYLNIHRSEAVTPVDIENLIGGWSRVGVGIFTAQLFQFPDPCGHA